MRFFEKAIAMDKSGVNKSAIDQISEAQDISGILRQVNADCPIECFVHLVNQLIMPLNFFAWQSN